MYRDPKSGHYHVSITIPGRGRTRPSTGTGDRKLAAEIALRWQTEALRIEKLGEIPKHTFDDVMVWHLGRIKGGRSEETEKHALARLKPWFTQKAVAMIKDTDVDACVQALRQDGLSDHTIRRYLAVVSSACTKASKSPEYRGLPNPFRGLLPTVDDDDHRIRWEERPAVHKIAEACAEPVMRHLIMAAAYSGMRQGELRGLEWSRVDLGRALVHLRPQDQKGKRYSTVILNRTAREALLERKRAQAAMHPGSPWVFAMDDGAPVSKDWIEWRFERACKATGVEDFHFHDLRHCFVTWFLIDGGSLHEAKELARHRDIRTTLKYAHFATDHLRGAAARLDGQSPVSTEAREEEAGRLSA